MIPVDTAWENFNKNTYDQKTPAKTHSLKKESPKCSDIYISTKTKITYLSHDIDLLPNFWKIPILKYQDRKEGVIKKQMKISCLNKKDVSELETPN